MRHERPTEPELRSIATLAVTTDGARFIAILEREFQAEVRQVLESSRVKGIVDDASVHRAAALDSVLELVRKARDLHTPVPFGQTVKAAPLST